MGYIPRLRTQYDAIKSELQSELGLTNVMQIPKLKKLLKPVRVMQFRTSKFWKVQ